MSISFDQNEKLGVHKGVQVFYSGTIGHMYDCYVSISTTSALIVLLLWP